MTANTPWQVARAVDTLQADLVAAIDRLQFTDPVSPLYDHERGYIAGIRSALAVLGMDIDALPAIPARVLRRPADQTDQLAIIGDTHA